MPNGAPIQDGQWTKKRATDIETAAEGHAFHCWVVRDGKNKPWAIPYSKARELSDE